MFAVPSATAVTVPFATVATAVLLEVQVRFLFVAVVGAIVATKGDACPIPRSNVALSNATPVTVTFSTGVDTFSIAVVVFKPGCVEK